MITYFSNEPLANLILSILSDDSGWTITELTFRVNTFDGVERISQTKIQKVCKGLHERGKIVGYDGHINTKLYINQLKIKNK